MKRILCQIGTRFKWQDAFKYSYQDICSASMYINSPSPYQTIIIYYKTAQTVWVLALVDTILCHQMIQVQQTFYVTVCLYTTAGWDSLPIWLVDRLHFCIEERLVICGHKVIELFSCAIPRIILSRVVFTHFRGVRCRIDTIGEIVFAKHDVQINRRT